MADLDPLIRYRKHTVEQKQRALSDLYRQAEELAQKKAAIEEEITKETELAEEMATAESSAYLGRYLQGARGRIAMIEKNIRKLETRIAVAQEDMRNAFAEMKKVEIVDRNRKDREQASRDRKDAQELDEMAIEQYVRRNKEET